MKFNQLDGLHQNKMPKFSPRQDYVLIKPQQRQLSEVLTIITAQTDQGTWGAYGTVLAVGPGKRSKRGKVIPLDLKVGEKVLYGGAGLGCIKFPKYIEDGEEYLIIQQADVCFVDDGEERCH